MNQEYRPPLGVIHIGIYDSPRRVNKVLRLASAITRIEVVVLENKVATSAVYQSSWAVYVKCISRFEVVSEQAKSTEPKHKMASNLWRQVHNSRARVDKTRAYNQWAKYPYTNEVSLLPLPNVALVGPAA